jgi:hypothetical protein
MWSLMRCRRGKQGSEHPEGWECRDLLATPYFRRTRIGKAELTILPSPQPLVYRTVCHGCASKSCVPRCDGDLRARTVTPPRQVLRVSVPETRTVASAARQLSTHRHRPAQAFDEHTKRSTLLT